MRRCSVACNSRIQVVRGTLGSAAMLAMKVAFLDLLSRGSKLPILDIFQTSNTSCNNCTTPVLSSSDVKGSMTKCVDLCVDEVNFFY
jgi:hypothetical protein